MPDRLRGGWFAAFVLLLVAIGAGGGMLLDRALVNRPSVRQAGQQRATLPHSSRLTERLADDLALTADQRIKLQQILDGRRKRLDALQAEVQARFGKEQDDLRTEIRAILTPEQAARFDGMIRHRRPSPILPHRQRPAGPGQQ